MPTQGFIAESRVMRALVEQVRRRSALTDSHVLIAVAPAPARTR